MYALLPRRNVIRGVENLKSRGTYITYAGSGVSARPYETSAGAKFGRGTGRARVAKVPR